MSQRRTTGGRSFWLCGGVFASAALFLLANLGAFPVVLWDESRLAVNALEMWLSGRVLVTTYNFEPDLWNTKPPLVIWLMTGSMALFGPSEWSLRLPSALAAVATLGVTMIFVWRLTRSAATTCLACVVLVASSGFYGRHAGSTGDYDALLTFFTTSYVCVFFFAIHRRAPPRRWLVGVSLLIAAAVMTKGVAGVIPAAGALVYVVAVRRWTRPFHSPWYAAAAGIVVCAAAAFYALRELAGPGYVQAVLRNELGGRYLSTIGGHHEPFTYFVRRIIPNEFSAAPLLLLVPAALVVAKTRQRLGILFATCVATAIVLVFSVSATKLPWYIVPAYPFLAITVALSIAVLARRVAGARDISMRAHQPALRTAEVLVLILSAAVVLRAVLRYAPLSEDAGTSQSQSHYGIVFAELRTRGIREVDVVDGGDRNAEGFVHYAPRLRFYQLLWGTRSFHVREIAPDLSTLSMRSGEVVVTCDPRFAGELRRRGELVAAVDGCVSVRR